MKPGTSQAWCATGCNHSPPTPVQLHATGTFTSRPCPAPPRPSPPSYRSGPPSNTSPSCNVRVKLEFTNTSHQPLYHPLRVSGYSQSLKQHANSPATCALQLCGATFRQRLRPGLDATAFKNPPPYTTRAATLARHPCQRSTPRSLTPLLRLTHTSMNDDSGYCTILRYITTLTTPP